MTTIADILDQAAAVIERNGHHKGDYYDEKQLDNEGIDSDECRVCALGAIVIAAGGKPEFGIRSTSTPEIAEKAARRFAKRLAQEPNFITTVGDWNDAAERTDDDVIRELRACAADLRTTDR